MSPAKMSYLEDPLYGKRGGGAVIVVLLIMLSAFRETIGDGRTTDDVPATHPLVTRMRYAARARSMSATTGNSVQDRAPSYQDFASNRG